MNDSLGSFPFLDAVSARDMVRQLRKHGDAEVTVRIAGTFLDVYRVAYDERRETIVINLHPDDVDDVLRAEFRRMSTTGDAPDGSGHG